MSAGMSCPSELATESRATRLVRARTASASVLARVSRDEENDCQEPPDEDPAGFGFDTERIVARVPGPRGVDARGAPAARRAALSEMQGRSRGHASSVCGWLPGGWRTISQPRSAGTRAYEAFRERPPQA